MSYKFRNRFTISGSEQQVERILNKHNTDNSNGTDWYKWYSWNKIKWGSCWVILDFKKNKV